MTILLSIIVLFSNIYYNDIDKNCVLNVPLVAFHLKKIILNYLLQNWGIKSAMLSFLNNGHFSKIFLNKLHTHTHIYAYIYIHNKKIEAINF